MYKKFIKAGNSWAITIPSAILEGMLIQPKEDKVELYLQDNEIRIRKIRKEKN